MNHFKSFVGDHEDFVHDVCFDFYGQRLATCSSDHKIKVWSQTGEGEWVLDSEVGATARHLGPVWKVAWAHPEFGSILASCSFDQTIRIWEEWSGGPNDMVATVAESAPGGAPTASNAGAGMSLCVHVYVYIFVCLFLYFVCMMT
jgi:WD40 repeat protein